MCTHKDCGELAVLYPVLMMRGLRWNGAFPLPLDIGVCAAHREELEEQLLSKQAWKKGITPMWNEMAKPKGSNFAGLKPSRHLLKIAWEQVVQPVAAPEKPEQVEGLPRLVHLEPNGLDIALSLNAGHDLAPLIMIDSLTSGPLDSEPFPMEPLLHLSVGNSEESEAAGLGFTRHNLCGGTGMRLDPLAHEGWAGECPGCKGCVELAPDGLTMAEDQTRAAIFAGDLAADMLAADFVPLDAPVHLQTDTLYPKAMLEEMRGERSIHDGHMHLSFTFTIPPDVHAEAPQPGLSEGSRCSRTHNSDGQELYEDGNPCDGIMERMDVQDCSCFQSAPCHNHMNAGLKCSECRQIVDVDEEVAG